MKNILSILIVAALCGLNLNAAVQIKGGQAKMQTHTPIKIVPPKGAPEFEDLRRYFQETNVPPQLLRFLWSLEQERLVPNAIRGAGMNPGLVSVGRLNANGVLPWTNYYTAIFKSHSVDGIHWTRKCVPPSEVLTNEPTTLQITVAGQTFWFDEPDKTLWSQHLLQSRTSWPVLEEKVKGKPPIVHHPLMYLVRGQNSGDLDAVIWAVICDGEHDGARWHKPKLVVPDEKWFGKSTNTVAASRIISAWRIHPEAPRHARNHAELAARGKLDSPTVASEVLPNGNIREHHYLWGNVKFDDKGVPTWTNTNVIEKTADGRVVGRQSNGTFTPR